MLDNTQWPLVSFSSRWLSISCLLILANACATAELTQRTVDEPAEFDYRYIHLSVDLANTSDANSLTDRIIKQLQQRGLQAVISQQMPGASGHAKPGAVLLMIDELDRRIETVEYHRSYGRTSLTRMRGRKTAEVPVIRLRATLKDTASGRALFQADYLTRGPWYADSATVVAALAGTLIEQLEREGFIPSRKLL